LTNAGAYSVTVTVVDSNGFSSTSMPLLFTVYADPMVAAPSIAPGSIDLGGKTAIAAPASGGAGGFTYSWQGVPTGCTGSEASFECAPSIAGTFAISAVATDANGFATVSASAYLVVHPALSVYVTDAGDIAGTNDSFSAIAFGGTAPVTFAWTFGDGSTGTGPTVSHSFPSAGVYAVTVWANDSTGASASQSWSARVPGAPGGSATVVTIPEAALLGIIGVAAAGPVIGLLAGQQLALRRLPGRMASGSNAAAGPAAPGSAEAPASSTPPDLEDLTDLADESDEPEERGGHESGIQDSKNISDGAAKSQAVDTTVQPGQGGGGSPPGTVMVHKVADAATPPLYRSSAVPSPGSGGSGGGYGVQDSKNISDGAAKSQAVDLTAQPGQGGGGSPPGTVVVHKVADAATPPLYRSSVAPSPGSGGSGGGYGIQDSKNISDGAAKGQAQERALGSGGSPPGPGEGTRGVADSKNISDGAAKGQAQERALGSDGSSPGSGGGGPGAVDRGKPSEGMTDPATSGGSEPSMASAPGTYTRKKLPGRMKSSAAPEPPESEDAGTYSRKKLPGRMKPSEAPEPSGPDTAGTYSRKKLPGKMEEDSGESTDDPS
jgi:hypothetical protein